ncbi:uncharacterized protein [Setaria viridis]|uniref:uncharacterized protein n=1 Tax=Setaria viridis TaxID=4556 RepID=UPI001493C5C9|nr:uncharacterized protein LOC117835318 [Setaria viridis]
MGGKAFRSGFYWPTALTDIEELGLDIIGPLPTVPGGFNRILVAINKFTKWIEVKPVTCPKAVRVLDFLNELVHRYDFSNCIIMDLSSNFNNHEFKANSQVERANVKVLNALKKRLHNNFNTKGVVLLADVMWKSPTVKQYE